MPLFEEVEINSKAYRYARITGSEMTNPDKPLPRQIIYEPGPGKMVSDELYSHIDYLTLLHELEPIFSREFADRLPHRGVTVRCLLPNKETFSISETRGFFEVTIELPDSIQALLKALYSPKGRLLSVTTLTDQPSEEWDGKDVVLNEDLSSIADIDLVRMAITFYANFTDYQEDTSSEGPSKATIQQLRWNRQYQYGLDSYTFKVFFEGEQLMTGIEIHRGETGRSRTIHLPAVISPRFFEELRNEENMTWFQAELWNQIQHELTLPE